MINDENITVDDNNGDDLEETGAILEENSVAASVVDNEKSSLENNENGKVDAKPILDYLSSDILTVKEYSFDGSNDNSSNIFGLGSKKRFIL